MKFFIAVIKYGFYMIHTLLKKYKFDRIKKHGTEEELKAAVDEALMTWAKYTVKLTNTKIKIKGKENIPKGNCLFVANHQGLLDIPVLVVAADRTIGFIAKKELLKHKILSSWMKEIHCVFIDRQNIREGVKAINEGIGYLKEGYSMAIFPEGTRSKGPNLGEFKKGSMKLGVKGGAPIIPVAINGTYKVLEDKKNKNVEPVNVKITFGEPIYPENLTREEEKNLAEKIKSIIEKSNLND